MTRIRVLRPLRLVDLRGPGLRQVGADGRLTTGDYGVAQRWAQAFHAHPGAPDGIIYLSRYDQQQVCLALFDRARPAVAAGDVVDLSDPANVGLLDRLLETYHIVLIDDRGGATP